MSTITEEVRLHKKLYKEYEKRYSPEFAQVYLEWWDRLILEPIEKQEVKDILDCGCGNGYLSRKIVEMKKGASVIGLDASSDMLKNAPRGKNLSFVVGDAMNLPFRDSFFDVIVCKESLHHLDFPEKAITEFWRTLRPNGLLLLSDPCSDSLILSILRKIIFRFSKKFNPDHGSFGKEEVKKMLGNNGFKVSNQYRIGYLAYPLCGLSDMLPILKYLPLSTRVAKFLIKLDNFFSIIPIIRTNNWLIITHAKKANRN